MKNKLSSYIKRGLGLIVTSLLGTIYLFAQDTAQQINLLTKNDPSHYNQPYVILISADGFRADFTEKYDARFLQSISKTGVRAKYMQPSYPSVTFPNHYTIVTGLYPSHHGLVDNTYIDVASGQQYSMGNKKMVSEGKWYGGTPLWVLAEQQKMIAASFFWVASEADIQGIKPTYHYIYNEKTPIGKRIQTVKDWLSLPEARRPHLITLYFPDVDHDAHTYGPEQPIVKNSVQFVDSSINALQQALAPLNLPINYIFVSDHGMTTVDIDNTIGLPEVVDKNYFNVPWGDALLHLYAKDTSKIESTYQALKKDNRFTTYKLDETPANWHYKKADDRFNRLGDLILVPKTIHQVFNLGTRKPTPGKHGFDNKEVDMRASFMAWGPAFKKGLMIEGFENVHVYPLVAKILGLKVDENKIDGKIKVLSPILKK
ncbi:MAG: alkaline phosphatase family protein [Sediminibacterium sp.]|nr:alkaline phosphatase family protein [Sediminibacterium sp.]MBP6144872.1 alkaline phosphatase family protein [Sediminibacterium sp.]